MRALIKVGGTLLDDPNTRRSVAGQLAEAARQCDLVAVHGGGKQVTRFLEERGISTRFIRGLRVSDEAVMEAVVKVIAGSVNKQLVAAITAAGGSAIGLSGVDGLLTSAMPLDPELEFVGHPGKTDGRLLELLVSSRYLPVIACIAGDEQGNVYNVNADQMAVSCALGWHADKLFFLSDVEGVQDEHGAVLEHLGLEEIGALVESNTAKGGMRAKLQAADRALRAGLAEVVIASGHQPAICQRLLAGEAIGTRLSRESAFSKGATQ